MAIFMLADDISGNVTAQGYENWIQINSLHFKVESKTSMPVGKVMDRMRGAPVFSELMLSKRMDDSTNRLFQHACTKKAIEKVEIHICSTDSSLTPNAKYILRNVLVTGFDHAVNGAHVPSEIVSLHFTKIETTYIGRDSSNQTKAPQISGYDLETAEAM